MTTPESPRSPKTLQLSTCNQTVPSSPPTDDSSGATDLAFQFRKLSLSPPRSLLPVVLTRTQPHSTAITKLDLSYSLLSPQSLAALCSQCVRLHSLLAVNCRLSHTDPDMKWPPHLHSIDLSRNKLCHIPKGIETLLYLNRLNLSGNCIKRVTPSVLQLPNLLHLYLISNPVTNIPPDVRLQSVAAMREYLKIKLLSPPPSPPPPPLRAPPASKRRLSLDSLRDNLLCLRIGSLDSGYEPGSRRPSTACSSDSETDPVSDPHSGWPDFAPTSLPWGYNEIKSDCSLCQLYLPSDPSAEQVEIEQVRDLSLGPQLTGNEFLITPVIRLSPHGMKFQREKPAIVVLCHCVGLSGVEGETFTVVCSDTGPQQLPKWSRMSEGMCSIFNKMVKFSTTHFSMFAVISTLPYPSARLVIRSNEGGSLTLPDECPGFKVTLPEGCLVSDQTPTTITATVYHADSPCPPAHREGGEELALASPVVELEPHGVHFARQVTVTLPVPHYSVLTQAIPGATLQLWTASPDAPDWRPMAHTPLDVSCNNDGVYTVTFPTTHFSFFEILWDVCRETVVKVGHGAMLAYRYTTARPISVRCQVFMTPPTNDNRTFSLLVLVYKFGDPMEGIVNYPWMMADSGPGMTTLWSGEVEAVLTGPFFPAVEVGGVSLEHKLNFTGDDTSMRFPFALRLKPHLSLPLVEHDVLGTLQLNHGGDPLELHLIVVSNAVSNLFQWVTVCVCVCVCSFCSLHAL